MGMDEESTWEKDAVSTGSEGKPTLTGSPVPSSDDISGGELSAADTSSRVGVVRFGD